MITIVYGSRPEAIKLGPVAAALRAERVSFSVVCTGQHTTLLAGTPAETDLQGSSLGFASSGDILRWLHRVEGALEARIAPATIVVVQGDTMSALAGARAAHAQKKVLVHVEAGVRSHNLEEPWPEEGFRIEVTQHADWHYAATPTAFANLVAEGVRPERIRLTGNPGVSALARYAAASPQPLSDHCFVTLHRREWIQGKHFFEVLDTLSEAATEHAQARFVWPVHPNVEKRLSRVWLSSVPSNLVLVKPLPYADAVRLLATSFGALTDSGGVAEEACTLGVPAVHLRNVTDRPEALEAGSARWESPTREGVLNAIAVLSSGVLPRRPSDAFGDVGAAGAIARHLASLAQEDHE